MRTKSAARPTRPAPSAALKNTHHRTPTFHWNNTRYRNSHPHFCSTMNYRKPNVDRSKQTTFPLIYYLGGSDTKIKKPGIDLISQVQYQPGKERTHFYTTPISNMLNPDFQMVAMLK